MTTIIAATRVESRENLYSEKKQTANLFCDIIAHYINANEDTRFFVLFNRREFTIKIKFKVLSDVLINLFVSPKVKGILLDLFCKSQRIYYSLSKFAHKYKFHKAKVRVDTDLCLNTIDTNYRKTVPIFDKSSRSVFLFTCQDLVNIIITALTHTSNFFIEPRICKNPYTNMPFSKSNLYSIYFHVQQNYPVIPPLLQSFFMCDFDIDVFLLQNEHAIRNTAVKNCLKNSSTRTLYLEVLHMLHLVRSNLSIDPKFPEYLLVDIMRPYLYLYLMFMYSIHGSEQRGIYYLILKKKMEDFFVFNKQFGRKRVDINRKSFFNSDYPNFTIKHINEIIQTKKYVQWYSYWNVLDIIPTPYTSQLRRLSGYSPSLYRTDLDYDEEDDTETNVTEEQEHYEQQQNNQNNTQESTDFNTNVTGNGSEEEYSSEEDECDNNNADTDSENEA